jgi:hypothetical protein
MSINPKSTVYIMFFYTYLVTVTDVGINKPEEPKKKCENAIIRKHTKKSSELVRTNGLLLDYLLDVRNPYPPYGFGKEEKIQSQTPKL